MSGYKQQLVINQSQRLVLTPQLRQRIEMLQMTQVELSELVSQQLAENPVLEELAPDEVAVPNDEGNIDFTEPSGAALNGSGEAPENILNAADRLDGASQTYSVNETSEGADFDAGYDAGAALSPNFSEDVAQVTVAGEAPPEGVRDETREPEIGERDSFEEIDYGTTFEEYLDPGYRTRETEVKETPSFEQFLRSEDSLADYLNWQLRLTLTTPEVAAAAEAIIGNLNDDGYLDCSLEEIMALGPWPLEVAQKALEVVQQLDPTGVAARNLQECLLLQLEYLGYGDRLAVKMIREHFGQLQQHKLPELAKALGVSVEQVAQELKLIRTQLEPHPGRKFAPREAQYIEPEVYIEKIDEEYVIRFNDDGLPQLRINKQYRQMMENKETSKETRDYIKDRFRSAVDLLKNIEHRKQTIYKVCERIVERQRDFLDRGVEFLKPMMLKDISEDIGMHLSTVSRVVNGKYAHTPQGVIELRRFFTEGMVNDEGEEVSTRIIKLRIKKMIEAEDARNPLTDDEIAKTLAKEGQKLSRRTVAKYRDQMKIPGSRERRQVVS
jgi:RNA polymerase sigma-54 factor